MRPPWRALVVQGAYRILDYVGGTLVMPMTVLVEQNWREISSGLAEHEIPMRHFVLHADRATLRRRIMDDTVLGPSRFRLGYLQGYEQAARAWLHDSAEVVDTSHLTATEVARQIGDRIRPCARAALSRRGRRPPATPTRRTGAR